MKYIYLITSPSGKQYVGKSTISLEQKATLYQSASKYFTHTKRPILESIRKYGWENMRFVIVERNDHWTTEELNDREKFWIQHYKTLHTGYNITAGGDGHDSESAKLFWKNASEEWKQKRALSCSAGQKKRYANTKDSESTRKRKSDSHKGTYKIVAPDGREWITSAGLKEFAEIFKDEIKISYWELFGAYRKCYNNTQVTVKRKNENRWKVTRID
jgi:group I intron endonuclease